MGTFPSLFRARLCRREHRGEQMRAVVFRPEGSCFEPFVAAALRAAGCEVIEAADEFELLAMVRDGSPDVVTIQLGCDASHPLDAVARRIRQADRTIPLFFLVAERDDALTLAAMRAGANDLLTERSTEGEIAEAIERIRAEAP